jgi:uncharacterized Zn-finger protein
MSEMKKVKVEPFCDGVDQNENVVIIVNNIKKEPEVEFLLILPPRYVKVEVEDNKIQGQNNEKTMTSLFAKPERFKQIHNPKVKCEICLKEVRRMNFKRHLKSHSDIKDFNCDHCQAGFVSKPSLVRHMWKHRSNKKFNCSQCSRGFNESRDFKVHLQSHSANPRPFQCDLCPKSYPTKIELKNHLIASHSEQTFKCDECDFTTKRKVNLNGHKKGKHSNVKPFSCLVCEKKFKSAKELLQHQAVHKTKKDFECKTCGKMFKFRHSLRTHEQNIHGSYQSFLLQTYFYHFIRFQLTKATSPAVNAQKLSRRKLTYNNT